jgi:hypothetical protein
MGLLILLGLVTALILLRYSLGATERRRHRRLRVLEGPDAVWWDGRTDVWRYDRHHWGWGWRP